MCTLYLAVLSSSGLLKYTFRHLHTLCMNLISLAGWNTKVRLFFFLRQMCFNYSFLLFCFSILSIHSLHISKRFRNRSYIVNPAIAERTKSKAVEGQVWMFVVQASWPLHPRERLCPKIRVLSLMSPWEKKRPGFRPSQHLWKCSRVTTTKSTCQHPAQWTSSPRLHCLQLARARNEMVRMPNLSAKTKQRKEI